MPAFSFTILFTLAAILAVSGRVFHVLCRQWTIHRPIQALKDWANDRKFSLKLPPDAVLPSALFGLNPMDPRIELVLESKSAILIRLSTANKANSARPIWHLLIRQTRHAWNPAGLRPVHAIHSFLDLFEMNGYPALLPPERFVAFGLENKDAKRIAASPARALLPADIGLLVHGPYLTLDFSKRPFDAIEFERMLTIMEQVIQHEG